MGIEVLSTYIDRVFMGVMDDILPIDSRLLYNRVLFCNLLGLHSLLVIMPSRMNGYVSFFSPRKNILRWRVVEPPTTIVVGNPMRPILN